MWSRKRALSSSRQPLLHAKGACSRYSDKHRYRPAASPIVKVKGKDGKIKLKGQYHP